MGPIKNPHPMLGCGFSTLGCDELHDVAESRDHQELDNVDLAVHSHKVESALSDTWRRIGIQRRKYL